MLESIQILEKLKLPYDYYEHEPILNYDTAKKVDERYHLTGVESKNLFIKTKIFKVLRISNYGRGTLKQ